jgi:hypothetical protein
MREYQYAANWEKKEASSKKNPIIEGKATSILYS